jgi:hypothetical protein
MDLESPFLKTAIVKGSGGALEEREVTKAKIVGDKIELITTKGGVVLFPVTDVSALLPKLPNTEVTYQLKDVDGAIQMLESLPSDLKQRPEASIEILQKWKDIKKRMEEVEVKRKQEEMRAEAERLKLEESKVSEWLKEVADIQKPRSDVDLVHIREQGQKFLESKVGDEEKIREYLALLTQVVGKEKGGPLPDLVKLNEIQPKIVADDFLVWIVVGVLAISFFGLLIGLSFTSSGVTRIREGAILGGVVFGGLGISILAGLAVIWWPVGGEGEAVGLTVSPAMEGVVKYAKNSVKPVYFLPSIEFQVSSQDFATGILASLPPSKEATGMFKGKLQEGKLWIAKDRYIWTQPVTALGIPIPVSFVFEGQIPSATSWQEITPDRITLGKVVIPEPLRSAFAEAMKATLQSGLSAGGLSGIKVKSVDGNNLIVRTPSSGTKPTLATTIAAASFTSSSIFRERITAGDLARLIANGKAKEFLNKFIMTEGEVYSVGGSNFSSSGKMGRDKTDDIYLIGIKNYYGPKPEDHLLVRCQIKSDLVFQMDSRGDLYARYVIQQFEQDKKKPISMGGAKDQISYRTLDDIEVTTPDIDPSKERPLVMRGKKLTFRNPIRVELDQKEVELGQSLGGKTGRPFGTNKNGEIELYGITLDPRPGHKIDEIIYESDGTIPEVK